MSNENEIKIVIGSKRYAGNTDKDVWIQPPLIGDRRELIEGDRSVLVNQQTLFEKEREELFYKICEILSVNKTNNKILKHEIDSDEKKQKIRDLFDEIKKCYNWENLRPCTITENSSKCGKRKTTIRVRKRRN